MVVVAAVVLAPSYSHPISTPMGVKGGGRGCFEWLSRVRGASGERGAHVPDDGAKDRLRRGVGGAGERMD